MDSVIVILSNARAALLAEYPSATKASNTSSLTEIPGEVLFFPDKSEVILASNAPIISTLSLRSIMALSAVFLPIPGHAAKAFASSPATAN